MDVTDLDADPLRQLSAWLDAARTAGQPMPEAMTIASATSDGAPSARLVVLRGLSRGLAFFTDCESDKGAELAANPRAAAVLHWLVPAHRQVRVAGPVERMSEDEADQYWSTRAPGVRLSAAASRQSRVVASRTVLETQVRRSCGAIPTEPMFPGRGAGAAFGCRRPASSSGRNRRTVYTTGSATAGEAAAGSSSGCRRNDPAASTRRSSPSNRPARHLLSQSDKREARRCAGKCSVPNIFGHDDRRPVRAVSVDHSVR